MVKTFRLKTSVKYQGMFFAAIFLAAVVESSSLFFLKEPAKYGFKDEHSAAILGGMSIVVYGTMLLLSVYFWAAYYVEKFTISGTTISIRSMFQNHQFDVSEIQSLTWGGSLLIGGIYFGVIGAKSHLDVSGYPKEDQLQIITTLRDLVPRSIQEGWPNFCHRVALPLREEWPSCVHDVPGSKRYKIFRRRYDRAAAFGLPLFIVVATILWVWLNLWHVFALLPFLIGAWLFLRVIVPPEGIVVVRPPPSPYDRQRWFAEGATVSAILLVFGLSIWGIEKTIAVSIGCVVAIPAFGWTLYVLYKADEPFRIADKQAIASAPDRWFQGQSKEGNVESITSG